MSKPHRQKIAEAIRSKHGSNYAIDDMDVVCYGEDGEGPTVGQILKSTETSVTIKLHGCEEETLELEA